MLISAKIFNEIIPINAIAGVKEDQDYLTDVLPQIQFKAAGLDKKYHFATLEDLKEHDSNAYWDSLQYVKPVKSNNIYFIAVKTLLFEGLCLYYSQQGGSGLGTLITRLPNCVEVDHIGNVKSKGLVFTLSGKLSKSVVCEEVLHGQKGSDASMRNFLNLINQ